MSEYIRRKGGPPFCVEGVGCSEESTTPPTQAATGVVTSAFGISNAAGPPLTDIPANVPQASTHIVQASSFFSVGSPSSQPDQPGTRSTQGTSLASPTVAANNAVSASAYSKSGSSLSNGAIAGVTIAA
jgi:hypothetical protein